MNGIEKSHHPSEPSFAWLALGRPASVEEAERDRISDKFDGAVLPLTLQAKKFAQLASVVVVAHDRILVRSDVSVPLAIGDSVRVW